MRSNSIRKKNNFDSKALIIILVLGFLLRIATLLATHLCLDLPTLFIDDVTYNSLGSLVADGLKEGKLISHPGIRKFNQGYYYYVGFIYYLFGPNILYVKIFNLLASLVFVFFIYEIAQKLYSERVAIYTAALVSCWPSILMITTINLKDILIIFLSGVVIWSAISYFEKLRYRYILPLIISIVILNYFRTQLVILFGPVLFLSVLFHKKLASSKKVILQKIFLIIMVGITLKISGYELLGLKSIYRWIDSENIYTQRSALIEGKTPYTISKEISAGNKPNGDRYSLKNNVTYIPKGFVIYMLSPLPWDAKGFRQKMLIPEVIVWYFLFVLALYGVTIDFKNKWRKNLLIYLYIITVTFSYSLIAGNIGTAYRHRLMVVPFIFIYSSVGLAYLIDRMKKQILPALTKNTGKMIYR